MPTPDAKPGSSRAWWCGELLERLGDYVEGALSDADRVAVEAHVHGCDWCARFGWRVLAPRDHLRGALGAEEDASDDTTGTCWRGSTARSTTRADRNEPTRGGGFFATDPQDNRQGTLHRPPVRIRSIAPSPNRWKDRSRVRGVGGRRGRELRRGVAGGLGGRRCADEPIGRRGAPAPWPYHLLSARPGRARTSAPSTDGDFSATSPLHYNRRCTLGAGATLAGVDHLRRGGRRSEINTLDVDLPGVPETGDARGRVGAISTPAIGGTQVCSRTSGRPS